MKKIKIVHIITRLDKGGSSKILLDIAKILNRDNFSIKIISGKTFNPQQDLSKFSNETGIEIFFVNSLQREINIFLDCLALLKLYFLIRKVRPDIVHTHTSKAGFLGRLAARLAGAPKIIYMPHGHVFYGYANPFLTWLFIILERFAACFTDVIITLTDIDREEFLRRKIGSKDKFVTIPNGINIKDYEMLNDAAVVKLRKDLDIPENFNIITTISRLEPIKGIEIFIKAIAKVNETFHNFRALIVGDGILRNRLMKLARELRLDEGIMFLGYRGDIKDIIYLSDVIVNSALNEGQGLVILEAMACSRPVIATKVGGVPEVIIDNQTGILVESGNYEQLATAIIKVLKDKDLATRLGVEAKKRLELEFSQEEMINRIRGLYKL
ncbi:MAG: glycosyltransferase family 4 protein [Candidatus Omnitrophota bacterium]